MQNLQHNIFYVKTKILTVFHISISVPLTIKTPERRYWRRSGVIIVNFEHISHLFLVFLLLTLNKQMLAG